MKYTKNIPILGLVAVVAGILGVSTISNNYETGLTTQTNPDVGKILGHITLIVKDKEGNIKQYRQTDNIINNDGFNCVATEVFGASTATSTCAFSPGSFKVIGLSATSSTMAHNTALSALAEYSNDGLAPVAGTVTVPTTASTSSSTTGDVVETQISNTFTDTGATNSVGAAALQDSATTTGSVNLFAAQTFGSAISLNTGDSLTVNWQVSFTQ
jgi:hypothetical protein